MVDCTNIPTLDTVKNFGKDAKVLTEVVTSSADSTIQTDSVGNTHKTLKGLQSEFDSQLSSALATAGYTITGSFEVGTTVSTRSQAVYYAGDPLDNYANEGFYVWTGTFDKIVTAGDTPFDESGWMLAATGYTKQSGAILLMGQEINANMSIPIGQHGFSIAPVVNASVTVPDGSIWLIGGDNARATANIDFGEL